MLSPLVEFNMADGQLFDLPPSSISHIENLPEGTNPNFPEARSLIRYSVSDAGGYVLLTQTFEEVAASTGVTPDAPSWLFLTTEAGCDFATLASNVLSRKSLLGDTAKCELNLVVDQNGRVEVYRVLETRDKVKELMNRALTAPLFVPPLPAPPAKKQRNR